MASVSKIVGELELFFKIINTYPSVFIQNFKINQGPFALGLTCRALKSNWFHLGYCVLRSSINNIKALASDFN